VALLVAPDPGNGYGEDDNTCVDSKLAINVLEATGPEIIRLEI